MILKLVWADTKESVSFSLQRELPSPPVPLTQEPSLTLGLSRWRLEMRLQHISMPDATGQVDQNAKAALWSSKQVAITSSLTPTAPACNAACSTASEHRQAAAKAQQETPMPVAQGSSADFLSPPTPDLACQDTPGSHAVKLQRLSVDRAAAAVSRLDSQDQLDSGGLSIEQPSSLQRRQLSLARALFKRGKFRDAVALLDTPCSQPASADAFCLKGKCLAAVGDNGGVRQLLFCARAPAT